MHATHGRDVGAAGQRSHRSPPSVSQIPSSPVSFSLSPRFTPVGQLLSFLRVSRFSLSARRDDVCGPFVAAARVDSLITPPRPFRPTYPVPTSSRLPTVHPAIPVPQFVLPVSSCSRPMPAKEKGKKVPKIHEPSPQIVFYECLHGSPEAIRVASTQFVILVLSNLRAASNLRRFPIPSTLSFSLLPVGIVPLCFRHSLFLSLPSFFRQCAESRSGLFTMRPKTRVRLSS